MIGRRNFIILTVVFVITASFGIGQVLLSDGPVVLEGLSATSVNMNYSQNGPEKLFDASDASWVTMPGAGPDEGVMLIFTKKEFISKLVLNLTAGMDYNKVSAVEIYGDGKFLGEFSPAEIELNANVKQLYVKIARIEGADPTGIISDLPNYDKKRLIFNSGKATAIKEMEVYGKNNVKLSIKPPKIVKGEIIASSTLKPLEAYNTDFLFDSRKEFGWAEGNKASGKGESLTFKFNDKVTINSLKIWNGYQRSTEHFTANERVKTLGVGADGQKISLAVADKQEPQIISLGKSLTTKDLLLSVDDVYAGKKYTDLVISELSFYDGSDWFMVYTGQSEKLKSDLLNRIKGTILNNYVDKFINQIYVSTEDSDMQSSKDLRVLIRSNNSFVIWQENVDQEYYNNNSVTKKIVYDGNWEIVSADAASAKIRIFGKKFDLFEQYEMYKGNKSSNSVSIFQDTITITSDVMTATKVFDRIVLKQSF